MNRNWVTAGALVVMLAAAVSHAIADSGKRTSSTTVTRNNERPNKGSGVSKTEQRDVSGFTAINMEMGAIVQVRIGDSFSVAVTSDDNLLNQIETRVRGRELMISTTGSYMTRQEVEIEITMPRLEELTISGSGDVMIGKLSEERLDIDLGGSAAVALKGDVSRLNVVIDGSGSVNAERLVATDAEVEVNGSGTVTVNAVDRLSASIAGSGDIVYIGSPKDLQTDVSGSGSIRKKRSN